MIHTYYVPVDSATGQKLKALADRIAEARVAEAAFMRLYGVKAMLPGNGNIVGGASAIQIDIRPNPRRFLPVQGFKNSYAPNRATLAGQEIEAEIKRIPVVRANELLALLNLPLGSYKVPQVDIHDEKSFIRYQFDAKWYPGMGEYVLPEDVIEKI
jgi:hypothetical protein